MGTMALLVRAWNSTKPLAPWPDPTSTLRCTVAVRISEAQPASKMRDEAKPAVLREIFIDAFPFSIPSDSKITGCADDRTSLKCGAARYHRKGGENAKKRMRLPANHANGREWSRKKEGIAAKRHRNAQNSSWKDAAPAGTFLRVLCLFAAIPHSRQFA